MHWNFNLQSELHMPINGQSQNLRKLPLFHASRDQDSPSVSRMVELCIYFLSMLIM